MVPLIQPHVPSSQEGTQRMRTISASLATVGIDHGVADRTEIVLWLPWNEVTRLELQTTPLELPQTVYQHTEDMHRNTLPSATSGKRKQTPIGTELTLHWPSLSNRPLLEGTWLAQSISNTSVAKLMKADVALGAVGEGVVLFVMRTETPSTSCL